MTFAGWIPHALALAGLVPTLLAAPAVAQEGTPGTPPLDWGPHGVGFRTIEAMDSTRAFRAKRDASGVLREETARPVRIALWYPARPDPDAPRMSALELRVLREGELDLRERTPAERDEFAERAVETATRFGLPETTARAVLEGVTPAVRDAPPVPGPHPTVLYAGSAYVSDPLTPAYLASHGYVVAAVPNNGRMTETSLEFSPNPLTLDTGVDDLGFAYATLRREPIADTGRLALYAFSATSLHALLWAMRDLQADAFVSVEGWERYRRGADLVRTSVHYDPVRVRVPVLLIERAAAETSPAYAKVPDVVDSLSAAEVVRVAFEDAGHGDFLSHEMGEPAPASDAIYAESLRIVREFLGFALGRRSGPPRGWLADREGPFTVSRSARPPVVPPSEEELFRMAETDPRRLAETVADLAERWPSGPPFREHVLARAALFAETPEERAILWGIVVDVYPTSAASRFRLGGSLAALGRIEEARAEYERALEYVVDLDAEDREPWRERIEAALADLETADR